MLRNPRLHLSIWGMLACLQGSLLPILMAEPLVLELKQGTKLSKEESPEIDNRPISVSAVVDPAKDGAVVSHGGFVVGYSLFVRDGKPGFTVRRGQEEVVEILGKQPLPANGPIKLEAELKARGEMTLMVDSKEVASGKVGRLLPNTPGDGLAVGDDPTSNVANYGASTVFGGKIRDVVVTLGDPVSPPPVEPIGTMRTKWADQVESIPHREYPRPQMERSGRWFNLNGSWDYAIRPKDEKQPKDWDGEILVPFAVESQLSGVQKAVGADNRLWYRRNFPLWDRPQKEERVLLHFGAVDWDTTVYINGQEVGRHVGGYDPFTLDVTDQLKKSEQQEIVVSVWDPTDAEAQPRGKQVSEPRGIWYTPVTGIWQTVWMETVPASSLRRVESVSDIDAGTLTFEVEVANAQKGQRVQVEVGDSLGQASPGEPITVDLKDAKLWSPDSPHLYRVEVQLQNSVGQVLDEVTSYAAMRKIHMAADAQGHQRFYLNNEPLFHFGPLDQGWWPDGLYTAPTDKALRFDIEMTKKMGFNAIRKHVKIEPARWYYHCDQIGMLVWQDMPTGFIRAENKTQHVQANASEDWDRPKESADQFEAELRQLMHDFGMFPSIVMWVIHNEGWGQYDTARLTDWVKEQDPNRLVNAVSGWTDRGVGDMIDIHHYPGPGMEPVEENPGRAVVLGEYGGLGWPVEGHLWWDKRNWGYRTYATKEELMQHYEQLTANLVPLIDRGLAAAIYTQTTDVEGEVNGLMTYDRAVIKIPSEQLQAWHKPLYRKPGTVQWLVRDSEVEPQTWQYTMDEPEAGWQKPGFDAAQWAQGKAPFGIGNLDFVGQETEWPGYRKDLWLRQEFTLESEPGDDLNLKIFSNTDSKIYLNGELVLDLEAPRPRRHYDEINLKEHAHLLREGSNVLAVHTKANQGPKVMDLGIYQ